MKPPAPTYQLSQHENIPIAHDALQMQNDDQTIIAVQCIVEVPLAVLITCCQQTKNQEYDIILENLYESDQ